MIYAYPQEVHDFVREHCKGRRPAELAEMCNAALGTDFTKNRMRAFCHNHGYKNGLPALTSEEYIKYNSKWPKGFHEFIVENSYGVESKELAKMVKEHFGIDVTPQQIKTYCQRWGIKRGVTGWFQKGHEPGTKGKTIEEICKYDPEKIARVRSGQFKKNHIPHNHVPVGTVTVVHGDKLIQVRETGEQWERWRYLSRVVWEEHNGPIPEGMYISFKDGDNMNCDISNLMMINRPESAAMTGYKLRSQDPDLTMAGLGMVRLKQKAAKVRKERRKSEH